MKHGIAKWIALIALGAFMLSLAIGAFGNCNLGIGLPSSDGAPQPAAGTDR